MNWLLDPDSLFNRFLTRIFDTLLLSVLTIVCSLPIITMGAALSALYDMMIKIVMDRDSKLFKSYFKSFAKNFKKGTLIWLICLAGFAFVGINFYLLNFTESIVNETLRIVVLGMIIIVTILFAFVYIYAFPLQARYENKVGTTVKNAFFISITQVPTSLGLLFLHVVVLVPALIAPDVLLLLVILEFSLTAYITARNMVRIFGILGDSEAKGEKPEEKDADTEEAEEEKSEEEAVKEEEIS